MVRSTGPMDILQRPWAIRAQLSYYLFAFRIYHQVRRNHERARQARREEVARWQDDDKQQQPRDDQRLELAKFPHLWRLLAWYQPLTNVLYVYALLKYVHMDVLPAVLSYILGGGATLLAGRPLRCFLVGRFVAYPRLDRIVAILHAVANLSWRATLRYMDRPYRLDLLDFLSQRDCHLRAYCAEQCQQRDQHSHDKGSSHAERREWRHKFHLFHSFMSYEATRASTTDTHSRQPAAEFKLCRSGGVRAAAPPAKVLLLRPNRSPLAKRWLERRMARMAALVITFLAGLCVVSLTLIAREITFDSRYLAAYPGCDLELEQLVRERHPAGVPLEELTTSTGTRLHWALGVVDFFESASIWFESGLGITFVFMLPYALVQDLKCYRRQWNARLESLLSEARRGYSREPSPSPPPPTVPLCATSVRAKTTGSCRGGGAAALTCKITSSASCTASDQQRPLAQTTRATQTTRSQQQPLAQHSTSSERANKFEDSIDELRQEICDFFGQFQQYELVMSDIISATFIFWFLGIFGFGYTLSWLYAQGLSVLGLSLPLVTSLFLAFFSLPLGLFSGCIFQLQASCSRSYQTLHSLLTYMRPEAKERYLKILEFFSEQKRHQFRFLLGHCFTPTIVVSILSWTTSWLALFMSIVK